jgi:hypothetical protein
MNHSFDIDHAKLYGISEAIIISNFQFWIVRNRANGTHQHDGRTWLYNSVRALGILFPYMTADQIRRTLESLEKKGVLVTGFYSSRPGDRTKWFAFADEAKFLPPPEHLAKSPNGGEDGGKPHLAKTTNGGEKGGEGHLAKSPNGLAKTPNGIGKSAKSTKSTDITTDVTSDKTNPAAPTVPPAPPAPPAPPEPKTPKAKASPATPVVVLPDWLPQETWDMWVRHRAKDKRSALDDDKAALCLKTLAKLRAKGNDPVAVIETSVERGWTGLFELKAAPQAPTVSAPSRPAKFDPNAYVNSGAAYAPAAPAYPAVDPYTIDAQFVERPA